MMLSPLCPAAVMTWTGTNGDFSDTAHWIGGVVPGSADTAQLEQTGPLTVSFTGDATVNLFRNELTKSISDPATLTLDLNGHTLTASGIGASISYDVSAAPSIGPRTLNIEDGTFAFRTFKIGDIATATASIVRIQNGGIFSNSNLVTTASHLNVSQVARVGRGEIYVEAGGTFRTAAHVEIGFSGTNASGLVEVSGSGASWDARGNAITTNTTVVLVGVDAPGALNVLNGGTVTANIISTARYGGGAGKPSTILVSGSGSSLTADRLFIGGGIANSAHTPASWGKSTTTVESGATLATSGVIDVFAQGTLVLNSGTVNNGGNLSITSGLVTGNGTISGAVRFNGDGARLTGSGGTLTLSSGLTVLNSGSITAGTVSIAGTTTVNSGQTLTVNGTLSGAGAVVLNGALSGDGTIAKTVTVNSGATLSPGNSPGLMTVGSLVLNDGGNYNWQIVDATGTAGVDFDAITVTGALDLSGLSTGTKFNLNLWTLSAIGPDTNGNAVNFDNTQSQSWVIMSAGSITGLGAGSIDDYFAINTAANNGASGFSNDLNGGSFAISEAGNTINLNFTAVPEPATAALLGLGLTVMMVFRRRDRK